MSAPNTITHDIAARLIGVTPAELTALVNGGQVRRADKNAYALPVLVQDYIGHLKAENERRISAPKQADIAEHLDLSDRSVREFLTGAGLDHKQCTLDEIRKSYIRQLREQAAGRAAAGDLDLATERALLAREQRMRIEMQNMTDRKQLIPADQLEPKLKAAFVSARENLLDAVSRLARELTEDQREREAMLQAEFEAFLHRLADWAHADQDVEDDA